MAQGYPKPSLVLALALLVSVAGAAATSLLLAPEPAAGTVSAAPGAPRLEERIAALTERIEVLERRLSEARPAATTERAPVVDQAHVAQLVARELERRGVTAIDDPPAVALDVAATVRALLDPNRSDEEKQAHWDALAASGDLDAVIAEFERRAAVNEFDSRVQTELAWAYGQKMVASSGPEAGRWGAKLAATLGRALELDETNWDARFSLATHEYWAGMRGDSIRNLETLLDQQRSRAAEPKHVRAYQFLGNLYMDRGEEGEAKRVWTEGLALFPGDETLIARLKAFE